MFKHLQRIVLTVFYNQKVPTKVSILLPELASFYILYTPRLYVSNLRCQLYGRRVLNKVQFDPFLRGGWGKTIKFVVGSTQ